MYRWNKLDILVLAFAGLVFIASDIHSQEKKPAEMNEMEQEILKLTNLERKKNDLRPLVPNSLLMEAARKHSRNMAKQMKLDHFLDNVSPFERIKATGYDYYSAGENLAAGNLTSAEIMKEWMDSKLHRDNILKTDYTEIGIAVVRDSAGDFWTTQVFARPKKK